MLRVLTLSTLFPNIGQPTLGVFVERQTLGLAALDDVELQVVSPIGLPPWPLSRHPYYRARRGLPLFETWKGLSVHRPRFRTLPGIGGTHAGKAMARALLPWLRKLRESFPFDVIDAEFFWPDGPAAMHLSQALDIPFSVKARGADIHYWGRRPGIRGQIVAAGQAADGLLAVSQALRQDMVALGINAEKITVHHTGVEQDRFVPGDRVAAKAAMGVSGPLLVTAGALIARKGQMLVLQALPLIEGASLVVVGDGPDRASLERVAHSLGVSGRVRFLGNRPHEELPALLSAADVMVLPSASEGLANVWVESLACGTPLVISDVGGAREVMDGPEAGRLVPREPEAIANAVNEILAAPPDPWRVRAAAQRFRWDRNAWELREHLGSLA
jgi:glycosyltransferase involved in cell wall biosynthesis